MLGSILDLLKCWIGTVIPVVKLLFPFPLPYKFKKSPYTQVLCGDSHTCSEHENLVILDNLGRVKSQIIRILSSKVWCVK